MRPQLHLFGHLLLERLRAVGALRSAQPPGADAALTPRQRECLTGAAGGETAAAIAERLGIGARTVTFHIEQAKQTLGARSIANAVAKALLRGDIEL